MNVCQVAVVLMSFLDCENVEPAYDLGNELPVVARSFLAGITLVCLCCLRLVISFATLYAYWNVGFGKGGTGPPWACVERRFWGRQRSMVRGFLRGERAEMRQATLQRPEPLRGAQGRLLRCAQAGRAGAVQVSGSAGGR